MEFRGAGRWPGRFFSHWSLPSRRGENRVSFGTRPWWVFLVFGLICCGAALYVKSSFWSAILGVVAFSSFWTIKELFEQKERVRKGWFPKKPDKRETQ